MKLQIVGKVRLALTPFEPQWGNVPLYLTARGLTTTPMQSATGLIFGIDVDLIDHHVAIRTVGGEIRRAPLTARPVAEFYAEFMANLAAFGVEASFRPIPSEVCADPIPFAEDTVPRDLRAGMGDPFLESPVSDRSG